MEPHTAPLLMPTLGRPFSLGTLYDARSDCIYPGFTLWDPQQLEANLARVNNLHSTADVYAEDTLSEKFHKLEVNAELKASFLAGLVEVHGAGAYLKQHAKTNKVAQVSLLLKTTSHTLKLTMEQLAQHKIAHPRVFDQVGSAATHVVAEVEFGGDAVFTFERSLGHDEEESAIAGSLRVMVEKLKVVRVEGQAELRLSDREKALAESCRVHFEGDFQPDFIPTTFAEAVDLYKRLPKLLREQPVPKKVNMIPLARLDSTALKIVRQISDKMLTDVSSYMEVLLAAEQQARELANKVAATFPNYRGQLHDFASQLASFHTYVGSQLCGILPQVRGGGLEEQALGALLGYIEHSAFGRNFINAWLRTFDSEVSVLDELLEQVRGCRHPSSSDAASATAPAGGAEENGLANPILIAEERQSLLVRLQANPKVKFIVVLRFQVAPGLATTALRAAFSHFEGMRGRFTAVHSPVLSLPPGLVMHPEAVPKPWSKDSAKMAHLRKLFRAFVELHRETRKSPEVRFVVMETEESSSSTLSPSAAVAETFLVTPSGEESFVPPSVVEEVPVQQAGPTSVTLAWDPPALGAEYALGFDLQLTEVVAEGTAPPLPYTAAVAKGLRSFTVSALLENKQYSGKMWMKTKVGRLSPVTFEFQTYNPLSAQELLDAACGDEESFLRKLSTDSRGLHARDSTGCRALHLCAQQGWSRAVSELLAKGAEVDAADDYGLTALHYAAQKGHLAVAQQLMAAQADPLREDGNGFTPLKMAQVRGHKKVVAALGS